MKKILPGHFVFLIAWSFLVCLQAQSQTVKPPSGKARDDAKDVACLIEGRYTVLGITSEVKDCMENRGGLTQNQFKQACEGLAQMSVMFGGAAGTVSYMGSCPLGPIALCDDVPRKGLNSFYYKESPNRTASDLKQSCAALGGKAR